MAPGLTEGANDETKARYAFVFGDFRRVHRSGLIACVYRAPTVAVDVDVGPLELPVVAYHDVSYWFHGEADLRATRR